jgi:hypothetical protein
MNCRECELLLADTELGGQSDALVEDHVRGCAACRALQEELRANALALSSLRDDELPRVKVMKRRPALPWIAAAAAAVLLALSAHQVDTHPQPRQVAAPVTGPVTVTAKLPAEPAPKLAVHHRPKPAPRGAPLEQPLLVKMLTPDPDVVVYWLVD